MHLFNYEPVCNLSWIKRCLSKLKSGKIEGIEKRMCSSSNTFHTYSVVLDTLCIYTISKGISACKYFTESQRHEIFFSQKLGLSLARMKCRQQFRAIFTEVVVKLCLHLAICFHSCKVWSAHEMTIFST